MKCILNLFVLVYLFFPSDAIADIKDIICEGTYNMGDGETPTVAESKAILNAKRAALEEAGTYVQSYSKVKNFQLTEDEVRVLASGLIEVTVIEKKRSIVGEGFKFWVKIKAQVQTDNADEMAKKVKEKSVVEDYKKLREVYEKSQKEIEELKRQLTKAKDAKERKQAQTKITEEENIFMASEWFERGKTYYLRSDLDKAIKSYTNATRLNPKYAKAYEERGTVWFIKGNYQRALEDFNKALQIDPNYGEAYYDRGATYVFTEQYMSAIEDLSKALAIDPKFVPAYAMRGMVYKIMAQNNSANEDFEMVIKIAVPNHAEDYNTRGSVYAQKGLYQKAIEDYNEALNLNPYASPIYLNRAVAYVNIGNLDRATTDINKACDLGLKAACDIRRLIQKKKNALELLKHKDLYR